MDITRTSDAWWMNAVFYCLDVETFQDGDGDGIGDFAGLIQRIDYLAGLGVSCLWLMPFYPSPNRDDGYDVTDYYTIDPRLGSLGDFVEFVRTAHDRGIRIIVDLVVNHTSCEHPWFQSARSDPDSPYRDWYVWSDEIPEHGPDGLVFPDQEESNWEWDEVAGRYYLHRFYKHQPDLNVTNPAVRDEIRKIVGFWLQLGVSGFRVDAVPFLLEIGGAREPEGFAPHDWLRDLRSFLGRRRGDALLLGEVNLEPEQVRRYFGGQSGDELHMCLNFNLNQSLALTLVREDAGALVHGLRALPSLPADAQWGNFLRNHDEWTLDKLTEAERQEVFRAFGPKPEMQIFGRGLRRRLPTMLDGDQARMRMVYSLMFALPGAPVLFYGEEIGMAENLDIPGRMSVRAPMQWSNEHNGGFSTAPSDRLRRPMVEGKRWGPAAVNVAAQRRDDDSLLNWMERLIRRRRETPEIACGAWSLLPVREATVLAMRYDWGPRTVIIVHNLAEAPCSLSFEVGEAAGWKGLIDLFGRGAFSLKKDGTVTVELESYGCRWFRVRREDEVMLL
ncbi:alpha-amylase family protein [Arenibaculum sp.]|uniref:alpha-amylase family protein n=1 Tax=Arenibaculum sp. TaxID=2865862 RepID=UPI002E0DEA1A|nr:alpha-amylase family protein [Arenibaculum sp.]